MPHIGHALEFVQTDTIARYYRSAGYEVSLVTGADENSLKNVHAAEAKGITPAELCERNAAVFKSMAEQIGLSFTSFLRTSLKDKHWPGAQLLWKTCSKTGDIYKKNYRGLYCVGCESFYEETELPDGVCPEHRTKPEIIEEENYFFRLSKYQNILEKLIENNELEIVPTKRKNEFLSFIKGGLQDFSISRSVKRAKEWGIPVPGDATQIQYVWFDALSTYLTGIGYGTDNTEFEKYWPADIHVIGKGIAKFHVIYWPAILLSAGLKLPKRILIHGYITVEGQKMSKSLGNIVDPMNMIKKYGMDPVRYYLLSEITFDDGDFSEKLLVKKNNSELVANVGNLVNRTAVFLTNNFNAQIPSGEPNKVDELFIARQKEFYSKITKFHEELKIKDALDSTMTFSSNINKYFQDNAPWKSINEERKRSATVLYIIANQVKDLGILLSPFLPQTSDSIFFQLALGKKDWNDLGNYSVSVRQKINKPKILFKKMAQKADEVL